jgi:hypothetical protein
MRILLLLMAVFLSGHPFLQATTITGEQTVLINTPLTEDLYVGANTLEVNATVDGDVVAAARYCFVRDTIREDAIIMGQEITLNAPVMDDARLMGGNITIRAAVFGDLFVGGGTITIDRDVVIHGNLYVAGGTVQMNGRVLGETKIFGGELAINGILESESRIRGENISLNGTFNAPLELAGKHLTLGRHAAFFADVRYWNSDGELDFSPALQADSRAIWDETLRSEAYERSWRSAIGWSAGFWFIARLLSAGLILLLLNWAFPDFFRLGGKKLAHNYRRSLGYGLIYMLGMPLVIILLFITVIGIPVGLFSAATYGFSLGWAHILAALLSVYWWQARKEEHWKNSKIILVSLAVFAALKIISWIPLVGWLIALPASALALGAVILEILHREHKAAETV